MEWGIINMENYKSLNALPLKRWDPLSTVIIRSKEFGLRKRRIRYYGHYSYLSPIRGKRPEGYKVIEEQKSEIKTSPKSIQDVFMEVTDPKQYYSEEENQSGVGYTVILTEDEKRRDNPFLDIPHRIEKLPDSCKALTLVNRYPAMARVVDSEIKESISQELPSNSKLAMGINLVTISRDFYPSLDFNTIPEDVLAAIFLSMKVAILYCIEEAINKDYYDIPVSPFFNIGTQVGGSQPRIHSQMYIDLNGDGHGSRLEGFLQAFKEMGENCHLCASYHGGGRRIILETDYWVYYTTGSPTRNYHIRFNPKEHIRRFSKLNINQINDLAKSLKIIFNALDKINVNKNRNILFNSCPYGYDSDLHVFADIIPHEIIGGAEMADDMRVARKLPEDAAEEIREAIESLT